MITQAELRRHPRYPSDETIRVSWRDRRGFQWEDHGHCVDASEGGLKVELSRAVPVNAWLNVSLSQADLDGRVLVRHCRRHGSKYVIGLAFQSSPDQIFRAALPLGEPGPTGAGTEPPSAKQFTLDQPPDDDVRKFLRHVITRKSERPGPAGARRQRLLVVTLIVLSAAGVLLILASSRLLRLAESM